jgi:osmotically-inducible protein OsmY
MMKTLIRFFCAFFMTVTLLMAVSCASTQKNEDTGEYVDDDVITTKIRTMIFDDPGLKSAQISVDTFHGVVHLSGFVYSPEDIDRAVEIARSVSGVKSVGNDMRLR